jgi:hypothetical protein
MDATDLVAKQRADNNGRGGVNVGEGRLPRLHAEYLLQNLHAASAHGYATRQKDRQKNERKILIAEH